MSDMTLPIIIFIVSVALLMFYLQVHCERILRRRLNRQFFHSVVEANRLGFPFVRKALEEFNVPVDYSRFRIQLKCDFLVLTYLLKHVCTCDSGFRRESGHSRWTFRLKRYVNSSR